MQHFQITTDDKVGLNRRNRLKHHWEDADLIPTLVSTKNEVLDLTFLSDSMKSYMQGAAGCLNTHRKAWRQFLKSNNSLALITEDDCIPSKQFIAELTNICNFLNGNFISKTPKNGTPPPSPRPQPILVQLGYHFFGKISLAQYISAILHILRFRGPILKGYVNGFSYGTQCYLINREMAELMLQLFTSRGIPIDVQLMTYRNFYIGSEALILRSLKNLALQERLDSSIIKNDDLDKINESFFTAIKIHIQSLADQKGPRFLI